MSAVATAIVGGAIIGGVVSSRSAGQAADAQTNAANQANQTTINQAAIARQDQKPWLDAGSNALTQLTSRTGPGGDLLRPFGASDFQADPGYQFRESEGEKGVTNSAAARGGLLSGAALKAASQYNQNFASNEYSNVYNRYQTNQTNQFNRLASIAGVGQTAANQNSNNAIGVGNVVGQNQIGAGNARASGYVGQANAVNGAIGQAYNGYQNNQLLNSLQSRQPNANGVGSSPYAGYDASANGGWGIE